jgi:hypothetical protein
MTLFQKNTNPKKLTLEEIWSLYRLMQPVINLNKESSLGDSIQSVFTKLSIIKIRSIMYVCGINIKKTEGSIGLVSTFTNGLYRNNFISFLKFIRNLNV